MTSDVVERLRPAPARPDPGWAESTWRSIVEVETLDTRRLGPARRHRLRRPALGVLAASAVAGAVVAGASVLPRPTVAEPAAPPASPASAGDVVLTDLGHLSDARSSELARTCGRSDDGGRTDRVHYARLVGDGDPGDERDVVVVSDARGGHHVCVLPQLGGTSEVWGAGPGVLGPGGDVTVSAERPLRVLAGSSWRSARLPNPVAENHLDVVCLTDPSVTRIQVRLRQGSDGGRWFEGVAEGGFAYVPLVDHWQGSLTSSGAAPVLEARAYDARGVEVGTDRRDVDAELGVPVWTR